MAEPFLSLGARERADILRTVSARSRRSAVIPEKDIWVCWVLEALFSIGRAPRADRRADAAAATGDDGHLPGEVPLADGARAPAHGAPPARR